jgi:hypothetical protein
MRSSVFVTLATLVAAGCSDNTGTLRTDAAIDAPGIDAPLSIDAPADAPGQPDAPAPRFSDAGTYSTTVTPNSVQCGVGAGAMTCNTTTDLCCAGVMIPPFQCLAKSPDGGASSCTGALDEGCDGPEDCTSGKLCCGLRNGDRFSSTCLTSCPAGQFELCHNHTQCVGGQAVCCTGSVMGFTVPTGACVPMTLAPPGTSCDTP